MRAPRPVRPARTVAASNTWTDTTFPEETKMSQTTKSTPSIRGEDITRQWHVIDLEGQVVGRAAVQIANLLRGRHRPTFTPHTDTGDFVVVINASKAVLTGQKMEQKVYHDHSNYPGGLRSTKARIYFGHKSEDAIRRAVWGMLPKGPLGREVLGKLKVYAGAEHPHQAQNPTPYSIG